MTSVKVEFLGCTYTISFGKNYHLYIFIKLKKQVMSINYHNLQSRKPQDLTCVTFGTPLGLLFTNELKRTWSGAAVYSSICFCFCFYVVGYMFSLPLRSRPTKMIVVIKISKKKKKKKNACRVKLGFAVFTTLPKTQSR